MPTMASIVYEGVGGGGDLFQGIKFYILQRVPTRNRWKGLVEANGGEVVKEDKRADIIIADHVRKDAPPGSISWTYIQDSVKNGELEDVENHRAGPSEHTIREVGSGQPAKRGRVPFSAEDDRALMEWCMRAEKKGIPLSGNEIYKQLEAKNNRHTFQSWRDRWVKYVSLRPRPQLADEEDEEDEDEVPFHHKPQVRSAKQQRPETRPKRAPASGWARATEPAETSGIVTSASPIPFITRSTGGYVFTQEETDLLIDNYNAIINLDPDQALDAWIAWSIENPNHTPQEWRNYFTQYIIPQKEAQDRPPSNICLRETTPKSSKQASPSLSRPLDATRKKPAQKNQDPAMVDEKVFKEYLSSLAVALEVEVDFSPIISGRNIPLFRIWQVVQSDEFGGFEEVTRHKQWGKVASKLNFNNYQHSSAAAELKTCYEEILVDFGQAREEFVSEESLTSSQERAMLEDQIRQEAEHEGLSEEEELEEELEEENHEEEEEPEEEDHDDDLDYPRSSPLVPGPSSGKRSLRVDSTTNVNLLYNKRQRIGKGKGRELEIPSTPEDILNAGGLHIPRLTPKPMPHQYSSPLAPQSITFTEDDDVSERLFVTPTKARPRTKLAPQPRILEPETQDFQFLIEEEYKSRPESELEQERGHVKEEEQDDHNNLFHSMPVEAPSSPVLPELPRQNDSNAATRGSSQTPLNNDSSTQSQTDSQCVKETEELIEHWNRLGYTEDVILEAMEATTFTNSPDLGTVMESLMNGDGIPNNMEGVWTESDDEALEYTKHSEEYQFIVRKHGVKRINLRRKMKREMEEV